MKLSEFNQLQEKEAFDSFFSCCGSTVWASKMVAEKPFSSIEELKMKANKDWSETKNEDWLEAFTHHPKIGDVSALEKKFAATAAWASSEQSAVNIANREVLEKLATGNEVYFQKFGFIFIVCATGKTASEMLELLNFRLPNSKEKEIQIAADEQHKITHIRLDKLFS